MFTLVSHAFYGLVFYYGFQAWETYKGQKALAVDSKQAFKNALTWPKYFWK